jgi:hypothetical protein
MKLLNKILPIQIEFFTALAMADLTQDEREAAYKQCIINRDKKIS